MVQYRYDAWGGIRTEIKDETHAGIAELNPFRYRSYYYDTETNLYYLNTRYYDPETGRFISQDYVSYLDPEHINGLNLFAYCGNNPVMSVDPSGTFAITALFLLLAIGCGAIIGGVINGVKAYMEGQRKWGLFGAIMGGAVIGGAMGGILAVGGAIGAAAALGTTVTLGGITLTSSLVLGASALVGAAAGMVSYSLENGLRTDREWNLGEMFVNGLSGMAKGMVTFGIGYIAGFNGIFDKLFLKGMFVDKIGINLGRAILAAIFKSSVRNFLTNAICTVGDFLVKSVFVSSFAAAARKLIDVLFGGIGN